MTKQQTLYVIGCLIFIGMGRAKAQSPDGGALEGRFQANELREVSGIAASHKNPNTFYIHNDSGDTSRFFAVNGKGELKATYYFTGDSYSFWGVDDCEDITIGPGPEEDKQYIYLADIGDNPGIRSEIHLFRFEEPTADSGAVAYIKSSMFTFTYPDGGQDAETIMIDPMYKQVYIISKRQDSVGIYTTSLSFNNNGPIMLQAVGKLHFEGAKRDKWIVSGSISPDGKQVLVKSIKKVYYWEREGREPIYQTLQRKPIELPYTQDGQQEAICFSADGSGYYITGEGQHAPIYEYALPKNTTAQKR